MTVYHDSVKKREVPIIFPEKKPTYEPTEMNEYSGPDIDWDGYNLQYMSAQLSKTMNYSNLVFKNIDSKLKNVQSGMNALKKKNNPMKSAKKRS